jgi:hypothetical protein
MRRLFLCILALILLLPLLTSSCSGLALIHIKQGDGYAAKGQAEQAIAEYGKAIELNHKAAAAYSGRGTVYFGQSQWTSAIDDFSTAVELDPDLADNLNLKRIISYDNRGQECSANGRYDLAVHAFTKAIELDPDSASAEMYVERAKAYLELGNTDLARHDYNQAIDLDKTLLTPREIISAITQASIHTKITTLTMDSTGTEKIEVAGHNLNLSLTTPIEISATVDLVDNKMKITSNFEIGREKISLEQYEVDGWEYTHEKGTGTAQWTKIRSSGFAEISDRLAQQMQYVTNKSEITMLDSEKIGDIDCHVFLVKLDPDAADELLHITIFDLDNVQAGQTLKTIEIKEWISKDEYLPVKSEWNMSVATAPEDNKEGHDFLKPCL